MGGPQRLYRSVAAAAALLAATVAVAQDAALANSLVDLRRQFGGCLSRTPLGANGSIVTIAFMMRRDGSIFGMPRITYSRLEGDAEARERFLEDAERAVNSCLPLKVTPALGAAIAGGSFRSRSGGRSRRGRFRTT